MKNEPFLKVLFATLVFPVVALAATAHFNGGASAGELSANMFSLVIALFCWGMAGWFLFVRIFGKRFFLIFTTLMFVKIFANFCHFYLVFAPLAGINSSNALPDADFSGDLGAIYNCAIMFIDTWNTNGLFYAIFGSYYRAINNPGVAIIYGGLFNIFGAYGTVAIPWAVLYSAFSSLLTGLIGISLKIPDKLCRTAALLVFFMPGFFIFPPIYRDNFIIFLLALSAYTAILITRGNILLLSVALLIESVLLCSLRSVYLLLPLCFSLIAVNFSSFSRGRLTKKGVIFGVVSLAAIVAAWKYLIPYLGFFMTRFSSAGTTQAVFPVLAPFKALGPLFFYPAAAVFSVLAPMPWWQSVSPALLSYQIFGYPHTWYSLAFLAALFYSYKKRLITKEISVLPIFALVIFLLALFGSFNFGGGYIQVALPFIILSSIKFFCSNWKKCLTIGAVIIAAAHFVLLVG